MQFELQVAGASRANKAQHIAIEAASEADAVRIAARNGWRVLAVARPRVVPASRSKKEFPLLQFSQELLALLEAGLNLTEAISTLHNKELRLSA